MSDSQIKPQELQLQIIGRPKDGTTREEKFVLALLFAQWETKLANARIKRIEDAFRAGRLPTAEELDAVHDGKAMIDELLSEFHSLKTGFRVAAGVDDVSDESDPDAAK
jgi:hypothetical protein